MSLSSSHSQSSGHKSNSQKIDWSDLFFVSTGRAAQFPFWIAAGILFVSLALYESTVSGALHLLTGWVVYPALFYGGTCVLSKRLHDRGRSGWWAAVILVSFVMVWPKPSDFFDLIGVIVLFWAVIDLCFMPGERGTNAYGPNLLNPEPVETR